MTKSNIYSLESSNIDVHDLSDVSRQLLQPEVDYTSTENLGTPENPVSSREIQYQEVLSTYNPFDSCDTGMYQYMWDHNYKCDSECEDTILSYGQEWSYDQNEEENKERVYYGDEEEDNYHFHLSEFLADPTYHSVVREYIHGLLEDETDPLVMDLLINYSREEQLSRDNKPDVSSPSDKVLHKTGVLRRSYGQLITMVKNCGESQFGLFKCLRQNHNLYSLDSWGQCNCCGENLTFDDIKNNLIERMTRLLGMDSRVSITDIYGDNIPDGYEYVDMEVFREEDTHSDDLIGKDLLDLKDIVLSVYSTDNKLSRGFYNHMIDIIPILEPVPTNLYLMKNNHPQVILLMVEYLLDNDSDLLSKWNVKKCDGVSNV